MNDNLKRAMALLGQIGAVYEIQYRGRTYRDGSQAPAPPTDIATDLPRTYRDMNFSFVEDTLRPAFTAWLQYKNERRDKKYTPRGLQMAYDKLRLLSNGQPEAAQRIVENSIANGWSGLFPLKPSPTPEAKAEHRLQDHCGANYNEEF